MLHRGALKTLVWSMAVAAVVCGCGGGQPGTGAGMGGKGAGTADAARGTGGADGPGATGGGGVTAAGGAGGPSGAGGTSPTPDGGGAAPNPDGPDAAANEPTPPRDDAAGADAGALDPACGSCATYAPAQLLGRVGETRLSALSGLAASWRNPGLVYVHNDRATPEIYALGEKAALVARIALTGAGTLVDIEDIEVGRCPAGTCIYVADIGANVGGGPVFKIVRAAEPALPAARELTLDADVMTFRYPGGVSHNAESLLVDALDGTLYVITKVAAGQPSAVYRLGVYAAGLHEATKVADLTVPAAGDTPATAGSAHPCGAGFLLRTNNTLYEFRTPRGTPLTEAFKVTPVKVPVGVEQQGEAVGYRPDGRGYYTTSEGAMPPLHRVLCQ